MANIKLQSAMEYLMTYGWAILIIAVVMVALFSLGILGGSPLGTTCLAQSGITCQSPVLTSGAFNAIVGQATGTTWASANIVWIPNGYTLAWVTGSSPALNCLPGVMQSNSITLGTGGTIGPICGTILNGGSTTIASGQAVSVYFPNSNSGSNGASASGQIWAVYTTSSSSVVYAQQLTTGVNLKQV